MNVSKSSAYTVQQWAEAAFWVLLVLLMVRAAYDALQPPETDETTDHPDYTHLSALDLETLNDGEGRRIVTADGDTLRLEGEPVEEGDSDG
ncbi:hypothetical protein GOC74_05330 [Halomicrobium mukohataei]|uniref:Uncharacterized protein n=1 Tax=Halomicrobium mukohataei TaxID=57705 RepID=A0A847UE84_9EURY|nr:hypothetical protein [Halomicrobium mukohataei]NLV09351.1 hypothetical protein [Halomicrobium mukohataei]